MSANPTVNHKRKTARMNLPLLTGEEARFAVDVLERVVNAIRWAHWDALLKYDASTWPDAGPFDSYWCPRCGRYVFDDDIPF